MIDSFRMREQDRHKFEGINAPDSVYAGAASSIVSFRAFLSRVEKKPGYMPAWWNSEKRKECEELGDKGKDWSNLRKKVDKDDVMEYYGDSMVSRVETHKTNICFQAIH